MAQVSATEAARPVFLLLRPFVWFQRLMRRMKDWTMSFASRPSAVWWLFGFSFAESSFFPIPPDILLLPIGAANPRKALRAAFLCTVASVLGGMLGWAIGYFGGRPVLDAFVSWGILSQTAVDTAVGWYDEHGVLIVLAAAITPIPYKVFTITSGVLNMSLLPFALTSLVGRGFRFMLEGLLLRIFGARIQTEIEKRFDFWMWIFLALLVGGFACFKLLR
ncbi:MAG: DedA family protein [Planctomycetota bacterium]|nr:DedA family protein [Planctomycetota bacterium]